MMHERQLETYEGLVISTARKYAKRVGREEDDMAQELRVRVWRAIETYDRSRCRTSLRNYVFSVITNKVKDYKRDASREAERLELYGLSFLHIEDMCRRGDWVAQEVFEGLYHFVDRDEVFGHIDGDTFVVPESISPPEAKVLVLLAFEMTRTEIALRLGLTRAALAEVIDSLRSKLTDWMENTETSPSRSTVQTVRADESQLVATRAA